MEDSKNEKISVGLRKILNYHGYGFHYSVIRHINELFDKRKTSWGFEAAEYPVSINDYDTRIDFILKNVNRDNYIVAECKRANPAFSNWCFVKAPYIRRDDYGNQIIIDKVSFMENSTRVMANGVKFALSKNIYHLGFEIRTGKEGEPDTKGRGAIEDASTQVCRGLNGLVEDFERRGSGIIRNTQTSFSIIPVIFTTARIWVSEVDLGSACLETGEFKLEEIKAEEKNWVWLEYPISPSIKNSVDSEKDYTQEFKDILLKDYIRSIAIVSVAGIDEFLDINQRW